MVNIYYGQRNELIIRRPVLFILFIVVTISVIRVNFFSKKSPYENNYGTVTTIEGLVTKVKIKESYASITVKTDNCNVLVRLSGDFTSDVKMQKIYDLVGRKLSARGKLTKPQGQRNPGCFDYYKYCLSQNIYAICDVSVYKISASSIQLYISNYLSNTKALFYNKIRNILSENNFSMVAGILFGESSYIDEDIYTSFKTNGFAHILAVSGLHVNITYELVRKLLKSKSKASDLISAIFILLYIVLANYSVSVIRASVMIIFNIIANNTKRKYDSLSSASVIAIVILLINPFKIYDSGMQLSFCAAYSMAIVSPWLTIKIGMLADKFKKEWIFSIGQKIIPTLSIVVGTGPLSTFHFLNFSFSSIILNPLIILLASAIMPISLFLYASYLVLPMAVFSPLAYIICSLDQVFLDMLLKLSNLGNILFQNTSTVAMPLGLLLLYYTFFFFYFSEGRYILHRRNKHFEICALESVFLCVATIMPYKLNYTQSINPFCYGTSYITFLDVGQGDCIHIHSGNTDILIDGGGNYYSNIAEKTLKPYLLKHGITDIDLAIITHEDQDHCKGIYELAEIFDVKEIKTNKDVYPNVNITKEKENDYCIVMNINIKGIQILLMSDADIAREEKLLSLYPSLYCDVIKIGHHGSAYSTGEEFIYKTSPSFAIISVGTNNYGHPTERVLNLLNDYEIDYARTDEYGAIYLKSVNENEYVFENVSKEKQWIFKK